MSCSVTTVVGECFKVTGPATGDVSGAVPDATREDVRSAIEVARGAGAVWRELPAVERGRLLRGAADLMINAARRSRP